MRLVGAYPRGKRASDSLEPFAEHFATQDAAISGREVPPCILLGGKGASGEPAGELKWVGR
jgi:hypothetical protein